MHINLDLDNNDHVSSNARSSQSGATLYVFEDNEAVIKMIIKDRSPTMRHVPRTHRVALDWLFERINQDPKIQIRKIETKHQQADILTERNFTRDEWNSLVNLFNVKPFQLSAALRLSAWPAAPERWRKRCKNRKKETAGSWQSQNRRRWTWPSLSRQVLRLWTVRLRRKALGYFKHPVEQIILTQEIAITTQRRVLKDGKKMHFWT